MTSDVALVEFPDHIELDLRETCQALAALDRSAALSSGADRQAIQAAVRLLTTKPWPELGDLLDDEEDR